MPNSRGKLIVLEGLDKAGKSSQCARLVARLEKDGHKVRHIRFPDRATPIGQMIDSYLKGQSQLEDHVVHLLFSANRWEAVSSIEADIAAGAFVVIDRYYYSGCVYSAAKGNPSLDLQWARHPEEGLPRPDICLFLDISPQQAAERGGFGAERYESNSMQGRVRELFESLRNTSEGDDIVRIDADDSMEHVEESIFEAVTSMVQRVDSLHTPLRRVGPW